MRNSAKCTPRPKQCKYRLKYHLLTWFTKSSQVAHSLDSRRSRCPSVQTSESYCRGNFIYTQSFFLRSFSRWVRRMIVAFALETYIFSHIRFLSNKAEFASPFYHISCTCLLFHTDHTYMAGQRKVFQLTLIALTFLEKVCSVFCMYTALTTENSMRLWVTHLQYSDSLHRAS